MIIPSPTRGKHSETDGYGGVVVVALRCGESALNCPFVAEYQLATLGVCRHKYLINTISCLNTHPVKLHCLVVH